MDRKDIVSESERATKNTYRFEGDESGESSVGAEGGVRMEREQEENVLKSIVGGVIVFSIGQDLTGEVSRFKKLHWKTLKDSLEHSNTGKKLSRLPNEMTIEEENKKKKVSTDKFVAPYRSYMGKLEPNEWYLGTEEKKCDPRDGETTRRNFLRLPFFHKNSDHGEKASQTLENMAPFDDILYRLMSRKYKQLTDKGRQGYVHILLDSFPVTLYLELKSGENSKNREKFALHETWLKYNSAKSKVLNEVVNSDWIFFDFKLSLYLHVDISLDSPVEKIKDVVGVERVGNLSVVLEPNGVEGAECPVEFLSRKPNSLYVKMMESEQNSSTISWEGPQKQQQSLSTDQDDEKRKNKCSKSVTKEIPYLNQKYRKDCEEPFKFLSLYDFTVLIGWYKVVKGTRRSLKSSKRSRDLKRYLIAMHEMRRYISMSTSVVRINEPDPNRYYFESVEKMPSTFKHSLEDLLDITYREGRERKYNRKEYDILLSRLRCSVEGDYVYDNRAICFVSSADGEYPEKEYYKNHTVYLNEDGVRWYVSWLIMIGDFIATQAESFDIHNREFIRMENSKVGKATHDLLLKAKKLAREYDRYYNIRNITDIEMKDLYDVIRESTGIEENRRFIDKRMQMLQNSEITADYRILQIVLIILAVSTFLAIVLKVVLSP